MDLLCRESVISNDCDALVTSRQHQAQTRTQTQTQTQTTENQLCTAIHDPTFLEDRCLENLLKVEKEQCLEQSAQCTNLALHKHITPAMRKIVAVWMMEVCEEQQCQEEVFLLALNYMDRFLMKNSVRKTHLQLLGSACLLLASKLREPSCRRLNADTLVFFTDNSISRFDLIQWELMVLSNLKWDISTITPLDFLEHFLSRLPMKNKMCPNITSDKIRLHAQAFISLAAQENFNEYSPSILAAASIAVSMEGLQWQEKTGTPISHIIHSLAGLISKRNDVQSLPKCMVKMEKLFQEKYHQAVPEYLLPTPPNSPCGSAVQVTDTPQKCKVQAGTPTDMLDVKF